MISAELASFTHRAVVTGALTESEIWKIISQANQSRRIIESARKLLIAADLMIEASPNEVTVDPIAITGNHGAIKFELKQVKSRLAEISLKKILSKTSALSSFDEAAV